MRLPFFLLVSKVPIKFLPATFVQHADIKEIGVEGFQCFSGVHSLHVVLRWCEGASRQ